MLDESQGMTQTCPTRGVSGRAIAFGVFLIPFNVFWIVRLERVMFGPYPSTISLFANVVFLLFVFTGINAVIRRVAPGHAFSQGELLTVYTMLAISTGIAGLDGVSIISQIMPHGAWFGKSNHWETWLNAFPSWLTVTDPDAVRGHFLGNTTFYRVHTLAVWIRPFLAWTAFVSMLMFVANCINVLVRPQWADRERLTFPVTWLPIEMTDPAGPGTCFYKNRVMWAGFTIAAVISLWNGIAFLYPSLPAVPVGVTDLKPLLSAKPWNAIDWMPITFYPLAIGLGFLLPVDLLFSCWFFFLYWKAQVVMSNAMGWDTTPDFPFIPEQGFGSLIGLFLFYLFTGRATYAKILRSAWHKGSDAEAHNASSNPERHPEALSSRQALVGIVAGISGLMVFCSAAHVTWWVALSFFVIFLATISVITRIRAELGAPVHDFHFMGPDAMIPRAFSSAVLRPPDMAFYTFSFALTRAHRSDTMPVGLEGLQMAKLRQLDSRRMFIAIILATVVGTLGTFWAFEHQAYALGAAAKFNQGSGHAQQAFQRMETWVNGSLNRRPNGQATGAMGIGLLTTLCLAAMRLRWFGFPFHPLGYALSSSWAINICWMPLLIAWALKSVTMRFGGLGAYRKALPFFLGLILGDCVMGSIWALISLLLNIRTYNFFGA